MESKTKFVVKQPLERFRRRSEERSFSHNGAAAPSDPWGNARGLNVLGDSENVHGHAAGGSGRRVTGRFGRRSRNDRFDRDEREAHRTQGAYGAGASRHEHPGRSERLERGAYSERGERSERPERQDWGRGGERQVIDVHAVYETSVPLGHMTALEISEVTDKGVFVNAAEHGALFVPHSQVPEGLTTGDKLNVFLYRDGQRVLATARHPYIELGQIGTLKINEVTNGTAYLDLGVPKELVLPVAEQRFRMYPGDNALVYVAIDPMGRLFATQKYNRYIRDLARTGEFSPGEKVTAVPVARTPLGFRVVVNDKVYGLIYRSEQKSDIRIGKRYEGFVLSIRPDGRLDISLQEQGRGGIEQAAHTLLNKLVRAGGHLDFNDRTEPEIIEAALNMSKGKFKKAAGMLYKQRLIILGDDGMTLTPEGEAVAQDQQSKSRESAGAGGEHSGRSEHSACSVRSDLAVHDYEGAPRDPMAEAMLSGRREPVTPPHHHKTEQRGLSERTEQRLTQAVVQAMTTDDRDTDALTD